MPAIRSLAASLVLVLASACATPDAAPSNDPAAAAVSSPAPSQAATRFEVPLDAGIAEPQSGRLIVIATPVAGVSVFQSSGLPMYVSASGGYVAAEEEPSISPDGVVRPDVERLAFPAPLSRLPPGVYWVQARLDRNHNAAYVMLDPSHDLTSLPMKVGLPAPGPVKLVLRPERATIDTVMGADKPLTPEAQKSRDESARRDAPRMAEIRRAEDELKAHAPAIDFVSPSLSAFWGRPMHIRGIVLLPPDYDTSKDRYPTVYRAEGFGGSLASIRDQANRHYDLMKSGQTPPMIRVFLDHSSPWGTTEFADSVNNGPWGKALTEELIPHLEKTYRMDAKPSGRFTTGHSSGGWFAIWQQVRYPKVYGGTWARAPDPVDFHSFTGVDIYAANANAYRRPDGPVQTLVRDGAGKETTSLRDYALPERVLGDYGGQFDSFDWVFSPKGENGRPQPLFDRATGAVDPAVAAYWREHYDIDAIIARDWKTLKPDLDGKIHLIIGDTDTFHLNEAAALLKQELNGLGAKSSFTFIPGGTHFNLDRIGADSNGLEKQIAWEMWAVARPGSKLKRPSPTPIDNRLTAPVR